MSNPFSVKATTGGKGEIPPAGNHPAVLVGLIDLGTHRETFNDKDKGTERVTDLRKVLLVWELTGEPDPAVKGSNHLAAKDYNLSFGPKAGLRKLIEGWRGKTFAPDEAFDLTKLLGQKCLLTLAHGESSKGNPFAKVTGIGPVPKGLPVPPAKRQPVCWTVGAGDPAELDWVPYLYGEPVKSVVVRCQELQGGPADEEEVGGHAGTPEPAAVGDEEIPF